MIYTVNHVTYLNDNVTVKAHDHFLRSVARSRYESTTSYYSSKINNALMQEIQTNRSYIHKEKWGRGKMKENQKRLKDKYLNEKSAPFTKERVTGLIVYVMHGSFFCRLYLVK